MEFRALARRRLPAPMFHYIDGGADDEWSLRNNTSAFDRYELMPGYLRDVSEVDTSARILGAQVKLPLILSPTGMTRLFHHEKELGVCKAAEKAGVFYALSTLATTSLEQVAETVATPRMFQVYVLKDRGLTKEFVERCKAAGYESMCLTVDTPLAGNRERDHVNGMQMPPRFTLAGLASFFRATAWSWNYLRNRDFRLANVIHRVDALKGGAMPLIEYVNGQFDRSVTWDDAAWLVDLWDGPLIIKGLQSPADAREAVRIGARGVMISNHGGRQLDCTPAPVDCVRPMRDAVGDSLELIVDGGVRRGTHLIKALALGADACAFGRPYLYALAAGGQKGVERMLALFADEVARDMALLGCQRLSDIRLSHVMTRD